MPQINNLDVSVMKRVNLTDRQSIEFHFQALNALNHAQYLPGYISDVALLGFISGQVRQLLIPGSTTFNEPQAVFSSHPRNVVLVLKYLF